MTRTPRTSESLRLRVLTPTPSESLLLILTNPEDSCSNPNGGEGSVPDSMSDNSDQAKQQRLLDFFRELGEQYWGWQNESAKRGRGFKGALTENFLPLLGDLRRIAAKEPSFCTTAAVSYHALCFLNRGLDECPPLNEDRDRDRHRMSAETAPFVPQFIDRIHSLSRESFTDSLICEMVKETFSLLDKLAVAAVSVALNDTSRRQGVDTIVHFVTSFDDAMNASQNNSGLTGASGKLAMTLLQPSLRSLSLFVTSTSSTYEHLKSVSERLVELAILLQRNDPVVVEGVLSAFSAFAQSCNKLSPVECDEVLAPFFEENGTIVSNLLALLATSKVAKTHSLTVSLLSSLCLLSRNGLERLLKMSSEADNTPREDRRRSNLHDQRSSLFLYSVSQALADEGMLARARGVLSVIDTVLGCISDGHQRQSKGRPGSEGRPSTIESEMHRRLDELISTEDDSEEMELREAIDHDELLRDEEAFLRCLNFFISRCMPGAIDLCMCHSGGALLTHVELRQVFCSGLSLTLSPTACLDESVQHCRGARNQMLFDGCFVHKPARHILLLQVFASTGSDITFSSSGAGLTLT